MVNQRLRGAILNAELTPAALAAAVEVDVKSVHRWLTEDRIPYPSTRMRVAHALNQQETFLWPELLERDDPFAATATEVERIWPARSSISTETWHALFSRAAAEIDILVFTGGFLIETLDWSDVLRRRAEDGARVRIMIGDPDSPAVKMRASELSTTWLPEKCRSTLRYLETLDGQSNVTVRSSGSIPYLSIFRFGDILLANTYAYGEWGYRSPVFQLRCATFDHLFEFYLNSFERVWRDAELVS